VKIETSHNKRIKGNYNILCNFPYFAFGKTSFIPNIKKTSEEK